MDKNSVLNQKREKLTLKEFAEKLNKSSIRRDLIPQELRYGWPAVTVKNGNICVTLYYYGIKRAQDNKVYIYPLAYSITALWETGKIVDFKCFLYDKNFKEVNFDKPCGLFPHKEISNLNQVSYNECRDRIFALYDELINCVEEKKGFENANEFTERLSTMIEPGHYPLYKALAPKFFTQYGCAK